MSIWKLKCSYISNIDEKSAERCIEVSLAQARKQNQIYHSTHALVNNTPSSANLSSAGVGICSNSLCKPKVDGVFTGPFEDR